MSSPLTPLGSEWTFIYATPITPVGSECLSSPEWVDLKLAPHSLPPGVSDSNSNGNGNGNSDGNRNSDNLVLCKVS